MPQFDVHSNTGAQKAVIPFVVVVQSRRFDAASRRVVIPLMLQSALSSHDTRFHPVFEVEGKTVVLNPLHIASIPVQRLGERVGSLKSEANRIIAALDLLITRAWD